MAKSKLGREFSKVYGPEQVFAVESTGKTIDGIGEDFCRTGCWKASQDICGKLVRTIDFEDGFQVSTVTCSQDQCGDPASLQIASGNQNASVIQITREFEAKGAATEHAGFHDQMAASMALPASK